MVRAEVRVRAGVRVRVRARVRAGVRVRDSAPVTWGSEEPIDTSSALTC